MKNKFYILIIVVLLIIIAIMGVQLGKAGKEQELIAGENKSAASNNRPEEFISIRFNEDISKDGTVEGVEGLSWNNIMINEDEFSIRADFTIENRTENKIGAQKLKVSFYNKAGKEIATKEVEMPAIEAEKYAMLNFEIEKAEGSDFELIHNVKISAK